MIIQRIGHREQAAAEVGADVVAVVPALAQLDPGVAEVVVEPGDVDAGEQERRPEIHVAAEAGGFHGFG
jgi:hypothetical protein